MGRRRENATASALRNPFPFFLCHPEKPDPVWFEDQPVEWAGHKDELVSSLTLRRNNNPTAVTLLLLPRRYLSNHPLHHIIHRCIPTLSSRFDLILKLDIEDVIQLRYFPSISPPSP